MNIEKHTIGLNVNFMLMRIPRIQFMSDGLNTEVSVDNKERLALAEKVQKDIEERSLNHRLIQRRDKIEREFEELFKNK